MSFWNGFEKKAAKARLIKGVNKGIKSLTDKAPKGMGRITAAEAGVGTGIAALGSYGVYKHLNKKKK